VRLSGAGQLSLASIKGQRSSTSPCAAADPQQSSPFSPACAMKRNVLPSGKWPRESGDQMRMRTKGQRSAQGRSGAQRTAKQKHVAGCHGGHSDQDDERAMGSTGRQRASVLLRVELERSSFCNLLAPRSMKAKGCRNLNTAPVGKGPKGRCKTAAIWCARLQKSDRRALG